MIMDVVLGPWCPATDHTLYRTLDTVPLHGYAIMTAPTVMSTVWLVTVTLGDHVWFGEIPGHIARPEAQRCATRFLRRCYRQHMEGVR